MELKLFLGKKAPVGFTGALIVERSGARFLFREEITFPAAESAT